MADVIKRKPKGKTGNILGDTCGHALYALMLASIDIAQKGQGDVQIFNGYGSAVCGLH